MEIPNKLRLGSATNRVAALRSRSRDNMFDNIVARLPVVNLVGADEVRCILTWGLAQE